METLDRLDPSADDVSKQQSVRTISALNGGRRHPQVISARIPNDLFEEVLATQRVMIEERGGEHLSRNVVIEHLLRAGLGRRRAGSFR